jgi:DNA-binding CsgD family transcriptional regulator
MSLKLSQMLRGEHIAVLEASGADEFQKRLIRFGQSRGFPRVSAMVVIDHSLTHSEFHSIDNAPDGYLDTFNDNGAALEDPVMQHSKNSSLPIVWDQSTYVEVGKGSLWEHQAQFGYHAGVAFALHFPGGKHFAFGMEADRPLPKNARSLWRIVADMQLFAIHAQETAFRIYSPPAEYERTVILTPRELEALRWTKEGKTAAEVGDALNISERTAVFHLQNAVKKLGCTGKYQAVLKAMRLGLMG